MGLIYAGMCAAILFGKVNRVQSHAHLTFANAVCLQYESVDVHQFVDDDSTDSDCEDFEEVEDGNHDKEEHWNKSVRIASSHKFKVICFHHYYHTLGYWCSYRPLNDTNNLLAFLFGH